MDPLPMSQGRGSRKGVVLDCPQCGASFSVVAAEAARRKYCSVACKNAAGGKQVEAECPVCGGAFRRAKSSGAKYCSKACYGRARQTAEERVCEICRAPLKRNALR